MGRCISPRMAVVFCVYRNIIWLESLNIWVWNKKHNKLPNERIRNEKENPCRVLVYFLNQHISFVKKFKLFFRLLIILIIYSRHLACLLSLPATFYIYLELKWSHHYSHCTALEQVQQPKTLVSICRYTISQSIYKIKYHQSMFYHLFILPKKLPMKKDKNCKNSWDHYISFANKSHITKKAMQKNWKKLFLLLFYIHSEKT